MQIVETVELVFDSFGVANFPQVQTIYDAEIMAFAIPELRGKTITGRDLITADQQSVCKLSMEKNSLTFVKNVPVSVFAPTENKYFFDDLEPIKRLNMRNCQVKYTGSDDVEGKAIEVVFKYNQK